MAVIEITNPKLHVGWHDRRPVFVAFSLETAIEIFDEHWQPIVLCIVVPHAIRAENLEQARQVFDDDHACRASTTMKQEQAKQQTIEARLEFERFIRDNEKELVRLIKELRWIKKEGTNETK